VLGSSVTVPSSALTEPQAGAPAAGAAALAAGADGPQAPAEVYGVDEVDEALRVLPGRSGPVVVAFGPDRAAHGGGEAAGDSLRVRPDRTYVITGGLGGLGLVTARKLVELGAGRLVLVSRSGRPTKEAAGILEELAGRAEVSVLRADLGSQSDVAELVARLHALPHPVGGIVHAAGAIGSELISALDWPAIEEQMAPKVYGGWLLHEAAASFPELDFFTVYSSIAPVAGARGGVGQAHYAAAFSFLDGLAHFRRGRELPALSVNWGSWARVGVSARLDASYIREIERSGVRLFSPAWGLRALHRLWERPAAAQRVVNVFDWPQFVSRLPLANALFERVAGRQESAAAGTGADLADLLARPKPERLKLIGRTVGERVAAVLQFASADEVDPAADFVALGLDSVMGMEVKSALESDFGLNLPASLTFDHPSISKITAFVDGRLSQDAG
jgi:acyl carrier protein